MPIVLSRNFGAIEYAPADPFVFPDGLPGFPDETAFLPVEVPKQLPLLYLQSLLSPDICFVALPVKCIVPDYQLSPGGDELSRVGLRPDALADPEMLCLALLCFAEDGTAAANLRAPVIINVKNRRGVQMIQSEDHYPIRYPLEPSREVTMCS
jgi:flagellar assembly factor FliW